jgi:hypothetical protein
MRRVIARGRDAADVAISTSFGPSQLAKFTVLTEERADNGPVVSDDPPIAPSLEFASVQFA